MSKKDLIKLYRQYQMSRFYHTNTDLASFIAYLEELELMS